jgi:hypothetical protein
MLFLKYERGDWFTVQCGTVDVESRNHVLTFAVPELRTAAFDPIAHANADEFLGVGPDLLMCEEVRVSQRVINPPLGGDYAQQLEALRDRRVWSLAYCFTEHASQGWSEFLEPAGKGRSKRVRHDAFRPLEMGRFFGASTFPLG